MDQVWCSYVESACVQALQRVRPYIAQSTEPEQQQQPLPSNGDAGVKAADATDAAAADRQGADVLAVNGSGVGRHMLIMGSFLEFFSGRQIQP